VFYETNVKHLASVQYCSDAFTIDPQQPNSPKNNRWPKIRRKKMRLAENPPNNKISAAAEDN